jgi:hypothetical protein
MTLKRIYRERNIEKCRRLFVCMSLSEVESAHFEIMKRDDIISAVIKLFIQNIPLSCGSSHNYARLDSTKIKWLSVVHCNYSESIVRQQKMSVCLCDVNHHSSVPVAYMEEVQC